jgi:hypothetical protein
MGFKSAFKGLIMYRQITSICLEIRTEHINALYGQKGEFENVKSSWYLKQPLRLKGLIFSLRVSKITGDNVYFN